ncbi:MAG: hypothetical protein ACXU7H_11830 [Burkholderiaceae bacterium]
MPAYSIRECADKNRILVIDRNTESNAALERILADESETVVMPDVVTALDWASHLPPELILLGTSVIATEGAGAIARFKRRLPGVKILIVCDALDDLEVRQAHLQGAENTLLRPLKSDAVRSLVNIMLSPRSLRQVALA